MSRIWHTDRAVPDLQKGRGEAQHAAGRDSDLFPIDPHDSLTRQRLFPMQIIAGSLLMGVVVFLVTVLYLLFRLPFAAYQWAFQRPLGQTAPVRTMVFAARAAVAGA